MKNNKWMLLQLFAGEGGDGAAAPGDGQASATVETSADDGHQRLRELGVPEDKIRKNRAYRTATPASNAAPAVQEPEEETQPTEQVAAAEENQPAEGQQETKRMTWDEIKNDPEYNAEIQKIIKSRLKAEGQAQQQLDELAPILDVLAKKHGVDAKDIKALREAIDKDDTYLEAAAYENNMSVPQYREFIRVKQENARMRNQQDQFLRAQFEQHHETQIQQQAAEMKKLFPNFDLDKERQNPVFARMISPGGGIDVRSAYYAVHHDELQTAAMQVTAQKTAQQLSKAIQSGSRRPVENGTSSHAPSVTTFDYSKASPQQRAALKQRIAEAAARGEYLRPGE